MKVSILIGTYGEEKWASLARERALPSARIQEAYEVICEHQPAGTIATCRNDLAALASGDWLCFLDADDELGSGFVLAMKRAHECARSDSSLLFTPRVSYVNRGRVQAPKFWAERPLHEGNWLIIGTLVPRTLFLDVGGFPEAIHGFEDWALFAKCAKAGAEVVKVPQAVYLAHVMKGSRNRSLSPQEQVHWHYTIGREIFPEHYPPEWLVQHARNARAVERRRR